MKKALYIGICSEGSTSKMRGENLRALLAGWRFEIIDTDIPFVKQPYLFRSVGFRYKIGPVVSAVNEYILEKLSGNYDLVWIDKGIFLTKATTSIIKSRTAKLVHYTPDTAFYGNKSPLFYRSINLYDYLITTKSFELIKYQSLVPVDKLISITQGFDCDVHKPLVNFDSKINRVAFVGLGERSREKTLQYLIDNNIHVLLAGYKWERFIKKNKRNPCLYFKGNVVWNEHYSLLISSSYFSLGMLSKRFPELHTTRTFEIPACGTALLTEKNEETASFFSEEQAIFYSDPESLVKKIRYYQGNLEALRVLTNNGLKKVNASGFDYKCILKKILERIL